MGARCWGAYLGSCPPSCKRGIRGPWESDTEACWSALQVREVMLTFLPSLAISYGHQNLFGTSDLAGSAFTLVIIFCQVGNAYVEHVRCKPEQSHPSTQMFVQLPANKHQKGFWVRYCSKCPVASTPKCLLTCRGWIKTLKVFSKLNDSMVLWFSDSTTLWNSFPLWFCTAKSTSG